MNSKKQARYSIIKTQDHPRILTNKIIKIKTNLYFQQNPKTLAWIYIQNILMKRACSNI